MLSTRPVSSTLERAMARPSFPSFEEECCTASKIDALAHTTTCLIGRNERTPTWDGQSQPSIEVSKCIETLILIVRERHVQDERSFEEECCTASKIKALAHPTTCLIGRNERTPTWDGQSQPSIEVSKCFETLILITRANRTKLRRGLLHSTTLRATYPLTMNLIGLNRRTP
uniref:uncharacterized protein LOC117606300 n=1 Tax=Osmia lignaria TaxID=473952 RepID=UPI001478F532|nr:uncharacterized protein LOC117606300 [Osmia lignaria]